MTTQRTFFIAFSFAALVEALNWFLAWPSTLGASVFFVGYLVLVVLGYLLASAGRGYVLALTLTWPFALLWLGVGILNFLFGRGENPVGWTSKEETQTFYGFVFAWLLFLPLAFISSAFGVLLKRLAKRIRRVSGRGNR